MKIKDKHRSYTAGIGIHCEHVFKLYKKYLTKCSQIYFKWNTNKLVLRSRQTSCQFSIVQQTKNSNKNDGTHTVMIAANNFYEIVQLNTFALLLDVYITLHFNLVKLNQHIRLVRHTSLSSCSATKFSAILS